MNNNEFSQIRHTLDMTQNQISRVLCVSLKAVQSFEQGWRNIPTNIEREMLLLLALQRSTNVDRTPTPCWEIKSCPEDWQENCLVWRLQARHFCWYLNGTYCQGEAHKTWQEKIQICRKCKVFKDTFNFS